MLPGYIFCKFIFNINSKVKHKMLKINLQKIPDFTIAIRKSINMSTVLGCFCRKQ